MNLFEERPLFVYCIGPLLVFFALTFVISDLEAYLSLVTANTLITHTYVWNLVTCSFYESNIFKVGVDIAWLWILSGWIGQPNVEQFGLYFIFTLLACSLGASILCFLQFSLLKSEIPLLTPMYGFNGVIMAMLMYVRQMFKQQAIIPRYPTITFHHLPMIYFTIQLILYFINFTWFTQDIVFTMIGMLFSWSYLRFYYKFQELESMNASNSQFGDKSEDFTFVHMFPEPVHIVLIPFTTAFYNILVLLSIFPALETMEIKRQSHHLRPTTSNHNMSTPTTPTKSKEDVTRDLVADRRRNKAMSILKAKIAELNVASEGWDDNNNISNSLEDLEAHDDNIEITKFKV